MPIIKARKILGIFKGNVKVTDVDISNMTEAQLETIIAITEGRGQRCEITPRKTHSHKEHCRICQHKRPYGCGNPDSQHYRQDINNWFHCRHYTKTIKPYDWPELAEEVER